MYLLLSGFWQDADLKLQNEKEIDMSEKILIVEDEPLVSRFVELELIHDGYEVSKADNGRTGLEEAESNKYSLILLDIMLPELNGLEVLRRIRKNSDVPVILLTAKDEITDKVSGLDMGANDYITKPFAIEELLARIRSVLRQREKSSRKDTSQNDENILECMGIKLDNARHTVKYNETPIELTNREFMLLYTLMKNRSIVMTRETLLEKVWGYEYVGETNVVDVYIRYLRSKIDDVFGIHLITTVRGCGYVIK